MSRSLNMVILIGHLTNAPVVKYTSNGSMVCNFSLATNRSFKKADGTMDEAVEYTDIEAWGKLAEICNQILTKGSYAHVIGELRTQKWTDQSGNNRSKTLVRINSMISLSTKRDGAPENGAAPVADDSNDMPVDDSASEEISIEEMPF